MSFLRTGGGILIPHARAGVRRVEMPQADGGEGAVLPGFRSCLLFRRYHSRSIEGRSDGMVKLDTIEGFGSVRRCRNGVRGGRGRCCNCGTHAEWLGC